MIPFASRRQRLSYWKSIGLLLYCCYLVNCEKNETTASDHCPFQIEVSDAASSSNCNALMETSNNGTPTVTSAPLGISSNSKCTIYLAPSTIPGAGLGIFTAVPKKQGEIIGNGDVFLPMYDLALHNPPSSDEDCIFNPFLDYVWTGETMGMADEVASPRHVEAMCPGIDAAINCNLALINVGKALPVWDDGGLHRSRDPGAGAITPYHNGTTPIVNHDIPAGGELFKYYGDNWFTTRTDTMGEIPLSEDYPRAQALLDAFGRLVGIERAEPLNIPSSPSYKLGVDKQRDLWNLVAHFPLSSRTMNALPKTLEDAWQAIQSDLVSLIQPTSVRDIGFLEEFGKCFDHIRPGRSSITQAGRGAFAVRPLSEGSIISGSPLLHFPHYGILQMYDFEVNQTTGERQRSSKVIGEQLLLNYCFGHAESTLILCPYGAGVSYINHNQSLANVRVQWSRNGITGHNDTWLNLTPPEMVWMYGSHLALDYVALRDIKEDDELFMDYGDDFEAAWQHHVDTWRPETDSQTYASAHDFNIRVANTPLLTEPEQDADPYPKNLQLRCHSALLYDGWDDNIPNDFWSLDEKGYPCQIEGRFYEQGVDYYDVNITEQFEDGTELTQHQRSRVPRRAIAFRDKPYTTDMHLPNAFRFPIMIPNEIFPTAWRNAVQGHDGT